MTARKLGVALLQMGGPATPDEIQGFISRVLADPATIPYPLGPLRRLFAAAIARARYRKIKARYAEIGGASPLGPITRAQAEGVAVALAELGHRALVRPVMRYSAPRAAAAVAEFSRAGDLRYVAVSLFPFHTSATTGSALADLQAASQVDDGGKPWEWLVIDRYGSDPIYQALMAEHIQEHSAALQGEWHILFSAHSIPMRLVRQGDRYGIEVAAAASGIMAHLPAGTSWSLAYQSKVGPVPWLGPETSAELISLREQGIENLLMIPLGFVAENLETLWDQDILYRGEARDLGFTGFQRVPTWDADPRFTGYLADLVSKAVSG